MSISKIRISSDKLLTYIRAAARSSENIVFIPPPNKKSMAGMMSFRRGLVCLQKGEIVGKPKRNEHGDWELRLSRPAANASDELRVIVECEGATIVRIIAYFK